MVRIVTLAFVLMLWIPAVSTLGAAPDPVDRTDKQAILPHLPIFIGGNADFTNPANGVSNPGASGGPLDPFIIENWDIDASLAHGISVSGTTANFEIRNVMVYGGIASSSSGIVLSNVSNGLIKNVTSFQNYQGILLQDGGFCLPGDVTAFNTITSSEITANAFGIVFYWSGCPGTVRNNEISYSSIHNNSFSGIRMSDTRALTSIAGEEATNHLVYNVIRSSTIADNGGSGIMMLGSQNLALDNDLRGNGATGGSGIDINGRRNSAVFNRATDNLEIGIDATGQEHSITQNTVSGNIDDGIYYSSSSDGNISENSVHDNGGTGIVVDGGTTTNVWKNTVYSNPGYGILLRFTSDSNITSNLVYDNADGIRMRTTALLLISGNIARNNTFSGIVSLSFGATSSANVISYNEAYGNGDSGITVGGVADPLTDHTIANNDLHDNAFYGVNVTDMTSGSVSNNDAYRNGRGGIRLAGGGYNVLFGNRVNDNAAGAVPIPSPGMVLYQTGHNLVTSNLAFRNLVGFLVLESDYGNNFTDDQAIDSLDSGFYFAGSSWNNVTGCFASGNYIGFELADDSNYTNISESVSMGNVHDGILLRSLSWPIVSNTLWNNSVHQNGFYGVHLESARNTYIAQNKVHNNSYRGIGLHPNSDYNFVTRNMVRDNFAEGLHLVFATGNLIHHNNFIMNNGTGLLGTGSAQESAVFITRQARVEDGLFNSYDSGSEGNMWSDFNEGPEGCGDGDMNQICDSPVQLGDNSAAVDGFPLTQQVPVVSETSASLALLVGIVGVLASLLIQRRR